MGTVQHMGDKGPSRVPAGAVHRSCSHMGVRLDVRTFCWKHLRLAGCLMTKQK